jgi:hypothetical protein
MLDYGAKVLSIEPVFSMTEQQLVNQLSQAAKPHSNVLKFMRLTIVQFWRDLQIF